VVPRIARNIATSVKSNSTRITYILKSGSIHVEFILKYKEKFILIWQSQPYVPVDIMMINFCSRYHEYFP